MENQSKYNLFCYFTLIVILIIVHYVIVLNPDVEMLQSQRAMWSWAAIGCIGFLGFVGVVLLNFTGIKGLWDTDVEIKQKVLYPFLIGLPLGIIFSVYDHLTGVTALVSASAGVESIHTPFPYSIAHYLAGAIFTNIIYYLILIPIVVFLVSTKLLKGKGEGIVFWSIGIPLSLVEPLTNPGINVLTQLGVISFPILIFSLFFNLLSVWLIRKYGFISAIILRIGFYTVYHILYPII